MALHRLSNQTLGTWGLERETFRRLEEVVNKVTAVVIGFDVITDGIDAAERAMSTA